MPGAGEVLWVSVTREYPARLQTPSTNRWSNTTNIPIDVTYVITPIANGCAGPTFNYVVTVNPTPTVNSTGFDTVCSNEVQNYLITGPVAGTIFTWSRAGVAGISNPAVSGQTTNPITEALINTANVPVNVNYTIIPSANGCVTGPIFTYQVTVNPTSNVTSSGTHVVCNNTALNYNITASVTGSTYSWSRNTVTGISNAAVSGQTANPITEALVNTTSAPIIVPYYIVSSANGCNNPDTFILNVTVNPTATLASPLTDTVCSAVALNHTLTSPVAGTTFSWTRAVVAGISNPAGSGTNNPITEVLTNTTNLPVNVTYMVTPSANGCVNPAVTPLVVTVNPTPLVANAADADL
jgi:hypothetical protein